MLVNDERDAIRRHKARAILTREDPDWRAVKRARRLLRDADRVNRVARVEAMKVVWKSAAAGISNLAAAYRRAAECMASMTAAWPAFRIPMLPPGEDLRFVAVKGASRVGKTAAMEAAVRDLDPYTIRPIAIVPTRHIYDVDALDLEDERVRPLQELIADRARQFRERMQADILAGRAHFPPPTRRGCRHGVWLFGDNCATCAREDRDEAASPDTKRDD